MKKNEVMRKIKNIIHEADVEFFKQPICFCIRKGNGQKYFLRFNLAKKDFHEVKGVKKLNIDFSPYRKAKGRIANLIGWKATNSHPIVKEWIC